MLATAATLAVACGQAQALPGRQAQSSATIQATVAPTAPPASPSAEPSAAPAPVAPARPALVDLRSLDDLKARFEADQGRPRLLLLVSPT